MKLQTNYMGIELKNPLIIGACTLSAKESNLIEMQNQGAAAIVYKSLFEEQLHLENLALGNSIEDYAGNHPEITTPIVSMDFQGPKEYIYQLKKARKTLNIPLFASLNAVYDDSWVDYARQIEKTGVDGLEINLYSLPKDMNSIGMPILDWQYKILKNLREAVDIPLAVKLSPYYDNAVEVVRKMDDIGADAFVLFNRFFQPDIDLEKEELYFPYNLSTENDYRLAMRFAGILYHRIEANICSSNGVYNGKDLAKLLLAGTDTVQIVSTLYRNGFGQIKTILDELEQWMNSKGYSNIKEFQGKLSSYSLKDPFAYNRAQYIDILLNNTEIENKLHF